MSEWICLGCVRENLPEGKFSRRNLMGKLSGLHVQIPMEDYKSLHIAVTICTALVNTQTHIYKQLAFDQLYY